MKLPSLRKTNRPSSPEEVRLFEMRWELRLPEGFKRFCLTVNGGVPGPTNQFFPVERRFEKFHDEYGCSPTGVPGVSVACFLSLYGKSSVDTLMELLSETDQLPVERVPVAQEGCGNVLMLSVGKDDFGAFYYWDHELQADCQIADSFEAFLEGLTALPPDAGGERTAL